MLYRQNETMTAAVCPKQLNNRHVWNYKEARAERKKGLLNLFCETFPKRENLSSVSSVHQTLLSERFEPRPAYPPFFFQIMCCFIVARREIRPLLLQIKDLSALYGYWFHAVSGITAAAQMRIQDPLPDIDLYCTPNLHSSHMTLKRAREQYKL